MRAVVLLFGIVALARAEDACPWMNAATAGGLLGGEGTSVSFVHAGKAKDDGRCEFTLLSNSAARLHIQVTTMESAAKEFPAFLQACGKEAKPVSAVGNEAVMCSGNPKQSPPILRVITRVRQQALVITLTPPVSMSAETALAKAKLAAELVTGNLF